MPWNHRIMKHIGRSEQTGEEWFAIHEVYYDKDGNLLSFTKDSISVGGDSVEEIRWVLQQMQKCLDKPILTPQDFEQ